MNSQLEWLATAVMTLDAERHVSYLNPAAENLLGISATLAHGQPLAQLFPDSPALLEALGQAEARNASFTEHEVSISTAQHQCLVSCTVSPVEDNAAVAWVLEFRQMDQQIKIAREERMLLQQQANRELMRNLAHEIKNPLGGIRGAAQLLQHELGRPELSEYTRVIIQEADRLQSLMDRLLTPHRMQRIVHLNIHEVLERVRSIMLAEHHSFLKIRRDYDTSLPEIEGDVEQLIQVVLNIVRNAVQAMQGHGEIILRTRVVRHVTLARKLHKRALQLQIIDNGPGIPAAIREQIFYPLVTGRPEGTGLGLTLAQAYVQQHQGSIECDSEPGRTCFTLLFPFEREREAHQMPYKANEGK